MKTIDAGAPGATFDVPVQAYPLGRWTLFKNPFAKHSKPAEPAPVQGELRLDLVRPIRNDLSDADLEVVPAERPSPAESCARSVLPSAPPTLPDALIEVSPPETPAVGATVAAVLEPEPAAWDRVKEKFFGVGKP